MSVIPLEVLHRGPYLMKHLLSTTFGLKQSKFASKRQADQFILYRDIYDLAVSVCKEWNIPLPDHGMDSYNNV